MTATANLVVRLPDPPIDDPPFKALWTRDGRLIVLDTRRALGDHEIEAVATDKRFEDMKERVREAESRARARVHELAKAVR
jgi:hypothetical protein